VVVAQVWDSKQYRAMTELLHFEKPAQRQPVFGVFSLAFPLLGCPFAYLVGIIVSMPSDASGEPNNWGGLAVFMLFSGLVVLLGFISAIIALFRVERFLILPFLGLIASSAVVAFYHFYFHLV
jgi:hypothetical protein